MTILKHSRADVLGSQYNTIHLARATTVGGGTVESFPACGAKVGDFVHVFVEFSPIPAAIIQYARIVVEGQVEVGFLLDPQNTTEIIIECVR